MRLHSLRLYQFKNYQELQLSFPAKLILFYGPNGIGKTNILDAIHYLAFGKSYFSVTDRQLVKDQGDGFRLEGKWLVGNDDIDRVTIKYPLGGRKEITKNTVPIKRTSELVGLYPLVFIAPHDIKLVTDNSKDRRDFVNRICCQADRQYLQSLLRYNRVLRQKNALLKSSSSCDYKLLETYNHELIEHGKVIYQKRHGFLTDFLPIFNKFHSSITRQGEACSIEYESQYHHDNIAAEYSRLLQEEVRFQRILIGTHKDDFVFSIGEKPLKKFGSQGQIKSFLYALRLAEYVFIKEALDRKPILILDDFFEKLDSNRLQQLLYLIQQDTFDQIFLSDTELNRTEKLFSSHDVDFQAFDVAQIGKR